MAAFLYKKLLEGILDDDNVGSGNVPSRRARPMYQGQAIPESELVDGEKNQMWTFKFQGFDKETGETVDAATEF